MRQDRCGRPDLLNRREARLPERSRRPPPFPVGRDPDRRWCRDAYSGRRVQLAASPSITLAHGRFQGSSSPGVPEAQNGFNATFKPRGSGNISVGAAWTVIVTDVDLTLFDVTGTPAVNVDEVQRHGVKAVDPPYKHSVDAAKKYKVMFRNLSADAVRPDLNATISFP